MLDFNRILIPTDFSDASLQACKKVFSLAKPGMKLELLHVIDLEKIYAVYANTFSYYPELEENLRVNTEKEFDSFLQKLPTVDGVTVTKKIEQGNCATIICEIGEKSFDLIAIGTHGRTGLKHLLLGSVAERVVQLCKIPVLTIRIAERK